MGKKLNVFISYRRADSEHFSAHLYDSLSQDFTVFFDKEGGIEYGEVFPEAIENGIKNSDVVLMIIGSKCCEEFKAKEGKSDFVVKEIAWAKEQGCYILPVLMDGVNMPNCFPKEIEFVSNHNAYLFGRNKFSLYVDDLKNEIAQVSPKQNNLEDKAFTQEVIDEVLNEKLVVLFSQDFTNISTHLNGIKAEVKSRFSDEFYSISIPPFVDEEEEYFACVAKDCRLDCEVKKVSDWNKAMQEKLKSSHQPILLFVTDLEDGNEIFDKQFATILRNLKNNFSNFHSILVGRKSLATLVYGEGTLSPLNNAKEIFFPEQEMKLGERKIVQQFNSMGRQKEQICRLLNKEKITRFATWSHDETINTLFWKNLLVKEGTHLVWRGELTKEIARDVLGCTSTSSVT